MKPMFFVWLFWFAMWICTATVHCVAFKRRKVRLADASLYVMWGELGCMAASSFTLLVTP